MMKIEAKEANSNMAMHLKILRQEANLTMRQLAEKLETPHSFVGKIELQGRRLDVGEFIHYCRVMQRDPADVLKAIADM